MELIVNILDHCRSFDNHLDLLPFVLELEVGGLFYMCRPQRLGMLVQTDLGLGGVFTGRIFVSGA